MCCTAEYEAKNGSWRVPADVFSYINDGLDCVNFLKLTVKYHALGQLTRLRMVAVLCVWTNSR